MIVVKDIYKRFGDVEVLKGISTSFEEGKTSLIIGQSGAGKTVFLKSLLGLHVPEEGSIEYNGKINTQMDLDQKREFRQDLGMVFQEITVRIIRRYAKKSSYCKINSNET